MTLPHSVTGRKARLPADYKVFMFGHLTFVKRATPGGRTFRAGYARNLRAGARWRLFAAPCQPPGKAAEPQRA